MNEGTLYRPILQLYLFLMATNAAGFVDDHESINPEYVNRLRNKIIYDITTTKVPDGEGQKFKDYGKYTSDLPPLRGMPTDFKTLFLRQLQDEDMRDDLQTHRIINWCRVTKILYAIKTKADGNCLMHAISKYVWGVDDRHLFLRRIVYLNLATDTGCYKERWKFNQQMSPDLQTANARLNTTDYDNEWLNIIKETEDMSQTGNNGLPYCTLQAVHLYVLANTFQRPIIVLADRVARTVFGQSLQENNIGGIYLPLEWSSAVCHKHPIVIGYNMNHFFPLLMEAGVQHGIEQAVPIVSNELLSMRIQFVLPGEEQKCTQLLQDYLDIVEVAHKSKDGVVNVPVARVLHKALPDEYNVIDIYRKDCEVKFRQLVDQEAGIIPTNPQPQQQPPFRFEVSKKQDKPKPVINGGGQQVQYVQKKNKKNPKQCLTMGCEMYGNPETRNYCSKCFNELTVVYSKQEAAQRQQQQQRKPQNVQPSVAAAREYHDLSMMGEDCKCGFKCSTETYPYCHECYPGRHAPPTVAAPHPPATGVDLSILPNKCIGEGCTFQCSKATFPYCHECYVKYISPQVQQPTAPPLAEPVDTSSTRPNVDQNLQLRIETQAEHTPVAKRIGDDNKPEHLPSQPTVAQPEVFPAGGASGELLKKCKTEGCMKRAVKGNDGTCDDCYSHTFFGPGSPSSSPPDEALLNDIRNLNNGKCCTNQNCNEEVTCPSTTQCLGCFLRGDIKEFPKKSKISSIPEKPYTMNISLPETREEPKILNSGTEGLGMNMLTPEAQVNGLHLSEPSGVNGTAGVLTTPVDHALPEMLPLSPLSPVGQVEPLNTGIYRKHICSTPGCEGVRTDNSYCYTCTKNMGYMTPLTQAKHVSLSGAEITTPTGEDESSSQLLISCTPVSLSDEQKKELNPLITSSRQKIKCASSSCPTLIYPPSKLCEKCDGVLKSNQAQTSIELNKKSVNGAGVPCNTPGCQFFGIPETGNYCSSCYKSGVHRHTAPLQTQKNPIAKKKHDTAPLNAIVKPLGKPCVIPGCNRFGDPAQADRCSQHYEEAMAQLPPKMSDQSIARFKNGPITEQKRSKPTNQNVAFHRPHTIGSSPIIPVSPTHGVDPLVAAMSKVESSRKSNIICKNNATRGCQNYGNSKNKGYCNTCFPEIQRLESCSRQVHVIGHNQFG